MQEEAITIKQKELTRYEVLRRVLDGVLSLEEATRYLSVGYRQARRLKKKVEEQGAAGLVHGNRGRAAWNRIPEEVVSQVMRLSEEFQGFNDTHFAEKLAEQGVNVSRESVRRLRRAAGVKPKRKRRPRKHHRRRSRKSHEGLMMLWDGSPHRWFGNTNCCLMAAMDDARGTILAAVFVDNECSWGYLDLLRRVVRGYGVPASVYQDKHTALKRNDDFWSLDEQLQGRQEPTQVGMALEALGIQPIFANSPQAKGRVEKLFETLQDRLVAEMNHVGIGDMEAANEYLQQTFIPAFNERFALKPDRQHRWRRVQAGVDLDRICSFRYQATVGNDNCIRFCGQIFDVPPGPGGRSFADAKVELRQLLDGSWRAYLNDLLIAEAPSTEVREPFRSKPRTKSGARAARNCEWVYRIWTQADDPEHAPARRPTTAIRKARGQGIQATRIA